jgi:hypothetical protein
MNQCYMTWADDAIPQNIMDFFRAPDSGSPGQFMNGPTGTMLETEHAAAPATNLPLDNHGNEQFVFDGTHMSYEWLHDIFCTPDQSSTGAAHQWSGETRSVDADSGTTPSEPRTCQNTQGPCIGLATRHLRTIRANSPFCLMGNRNHIARSPRPVDAILSMAQEASRAMSDIVRCSCHESLQLQLLVTVICTEVVGCYRRCIGIYSRPGDTDLQSGSHHVEEQPSVLKRRFSIGDHQMESHLEARLIGQVLCSRLQEVEFIMDNIARSSRSSAPTMDETYSVLLGSVHTRRNSFLRTELGDAKRELATLFERARIPGVTDLGVQCVLKGDTMDTSTFLD